MTAQYLSRAGAHLNGLRQGWLARVSSRTALSTLLGIGAADLLLLNFWAVPSALQQTDMRAARSAPLTAARPPALVQTQASAVPAPAEPLPSSARAAAEPEAVSAPVTTRPAALAKASRGSGAETTATIYFGTGNWWIGPRNRRALDEALPKLLADSRTIEVIGYADSRGTNELNQRISEERARAVAAVLVSAGLPAARIRYVGAGEELAAGSGMDRRAEVNLSEGGPSP